MTPNISVANYLLSRVNVEESKTIPMDAVDAAKDADWVAYCPRSEGG